MEIEESNSYSIKSEDYNNSTYNIDNSTCNVATFSCNVYSKSPGTNNYILHVSATNDTYPHIAAACSDYTCFIYDLTESSVAKIAQLKEHTNTLIDCKFSSENNSLLYTGSNDGTIKLWDLRQSEGSAVTFADTTLKDSSIVKTLSSFDVSPCNRLLAAGTNLTEGDAFILFWDIRNIKLLGAYWESHNDDIIQVKFNPEQSNTLLSGSTDGLINMYDLSESCEDDALKECLNTGALVENLQWFYERGQWKISCITSTFDLQLWDTDGAEPYRNFRREDIAETIKVKTKNTYLVNTHPVANSLLLLVGSSNKGRDILLATEITNKLMLPAIQFTGNLQRVRASWFNENTNLLITGGENGNLDIWKPDFRIVNFKTSKKK